MSGLSDTSECWPISRIDFWPSMVTFDVILEQMDHESHRPVPRFAIPSCKLLCRARGKYQNCQGVRTDHGPD